MMRRPLFSSPLNLFELLNLDESFMALLGFEPSLLYAQCFDVQTSPLLHAN
jgi:hypothetical protein